MRTYVDAMAKRLGASKERRSQFAARLAAMEPDELAAEYLKAETEIAEAKDPPNLTRIRKRLALIDAVGHWVHHPDWSLARSKRFPSK